MLSYCRVTCDNVLSIAGFRIVYNMDTRFHGYDTFTTAH